jgi:hypothetical protein
MNTGIEGNEDKKSFLLNPPDETPKLPIFLAVFGSILAVGLSGFGLQHIRTGTENHLTGRAQSSRILKNNRADQKIIRSFDPKFPAPSILLSRPH